MRRVVTLITNLRACDLLSAGPGSRLIVCLAGAEVVGLSRSYCEGNPLAALVGSSGYLEVAYRNGSAAAHLGARVGDKVEVGTR